MSTQLFLPLAYLHVYRVEHRAEVLGIFAKISSQKTQIKECHLVEQL